MKTFDKRIGKDTLLIEPWTEDAIRIRQTKLNHFKKYDWILEKPTKPEFKVVKHNNGSIVIKLSKMELLIDEMNYISYFETGSKEPFLEEKKSPKVFSEGGRSLKAVSGNLFNAQVYFKAKEDERFWGLGQHQYNCFDQKGMVIPLCQMNSQVTVPLLISSKGYGIFWNNPANGQIELAFNRTRWVVDHTDQIDFFVIYGPDPSSILFQYYQITGFPSPLPYWSTGFWQCKLRYETQEEFLAVAKEHKNRNLPLSVMVIDYFHWEKQGEWDFDKKCWPDPDKMIKELKDMDIETMVSVWPSVNPDSKYFDEMDKKGYLIETDKGTNAGFLFTDTYEKGKKYIHYYDATNKAAGNFIWKQVKKNYFNRGVKTYWLDACEPETIPYDYENLRYHEGNGASIGALYPLFHEKNFYENMIKEGVEKPLNLCRSAWAGSHKYGAAVWSGDIYSTFESLETQIKAGLNMISSGIPWWTTDIGGFFGGDVEDPDFRELIVRWFQFGLFCPIFRLHGFRNSWDPKKGGDNEVWSFGKEAYNHIVKYLKFRELLRPYIIKEAEKTCSKGIPLMRPLVFDFYYDNKSHLIDDQFLFGEEILVAPIYKKGTLSRSVYLPEGVNWLNPYTNEKIRGGQTINYCLTIDKAPFFLKEGSKLKRHVNLLY